jgi:hypothetical protein
MMTVNEMIRPEEARELAKANEDSFSMFEQINELIRNEASQGNVDCSYDVPEDVSEIATDMVVKQLKDFGYRAEIRSKVTKPYHRSYWINIDWREE